VKFTVVTILPELIEPALAAGVVGRARDAGTIAVDTVNPRDFTHDKHRSVDDTPYGGGPGMVMKPEPLLAAIERACSPPGAASSPRPHRILLSPSGTPLTQVRVRELAALDHLVLVCGRYEGVDQRVIDAAIDEEISIGDYVLSGGELGALVIIDAVARFVPGVLGAAESTDDESHAAGLLEYPQYTRPAELAGAAVPPILMSGNHAAIAAWRRDQSMIRTAVRRPDMWKRFRPTAADEKRIGTRTPGSGTPTSASADTAVATVRLCARTSLALVHHPVVDRTGAVVTTALTNFDVHDLARSAMTYGLRAVYIVTPITSQREKADHIAAVWAADDQGEHRSRALALVRSVASVDEALAGVAAHASGEPLVVATSARADSFPGVARRTPDELVAEATATDRAMLVLLGTGWGLADSLIPSVSRVLAPIEGASAWNHLSVRSAAAVLLDRLFGRAP
jgi:tRNA (guanine37-N1)-methyltransferase